MGFTVQGVLFMISNYSSFIAMIISFSLMSACLGSGARDLSAEVGDSMLARAAAAGHSD